MAPFLTKRDPTTMTTEEIAVGIKDWCLDRVKRPELSREDARSLVAEFYEWIEPEGDQIEIFTLDLLEP